MNNLFGWGGGARRDPLLEDDGASAPWDEETASRPPPFNPGTGGYDDRGGYGDYDDGYMQQPLPPRRAQQQPARLSPRPETRASPRVSPRQQQQVVYPRDGPQTIYVQQPNQQAPQPVVITVRHENARAPVAEGVCCALMIFILGFTFPLLWLLACCQLGSPSRSVRFLSRCSILALILVTTGLGAIILNDAKTGKWPWDTECFFPWDPKCKYPPV
mmetsp:Transcript_39243/g.76757  ORF Transcript_39243/g.76757 Transcript_39243/m.76757 type:complete len:216 (+) Transcript_39243:233-880(+)